MIKVANIVGARPQFIKYLPVSRAIETKHTGITSDIKDILIHTGQHYDYKMSKVFFDEFGIREPDYHLEVGSGSHGEQTGQIIQRTEEVLIKEKPDIVLVYGDTNSTLGGSIAASKLHIPIAHVEAGLRSYNKFMPEEINRILTDHISRLLLCPSMTAVDNLADEGFKNALNGGMLVSHDYFSDDETSINADKNNPSVINVGDVMYDAMIYALELAKRKSHILKQLQFDAGDFYLLTLHRAENTDSDEQFQKIVNFVNEVATGKTVVFPMHPRTKNVYGKSKKKFTDNVRIIEPVGYFDILILLDNCELVLTDSGGMQKEAFWLKTPCITLRDETEWVETVQTGWNILYNQYKGSHDPDDRINDCYGDGRAAERVAAALIRYSS